MPDITNTYKLTIRSSAVSQPRGEFRQKQEKRIRKDLDMLLGPGNYDLALMPSSTHNTGPGLNGVPLGAPDSHTTKNTGNGSH